MYYINDLKPLFRTFRILISRIDLNVKQNGSWNCGTGCQLGENAARNRLLNGSFVFLRYFLTITSFLFAAVSVSAQTVVWVAPFRSVEIRDSGHIILRHGPTQTVTLLKGSTDCVRFIIADGDRLVVDKYKGGCAEKYEPEIEIITPEIVEVRVSNGGTIQTHGNFPRQSQIKAAVSNGGTIDIRTIMPERVTALVEEGGGIFVKPQTILSASITNGGQIIYWGNPGVELSVRGGGAVTKGNADELDKPLSRSSYPMNCSLL